MVKVQYSPRNNNFWVYIPRSIVSKLKLEKGDEVEIDIHLKKEAV